MLLGGEVDLSYANLLYKLSGTGMLITCENMGMAGRVPSQNYSVYQHIRQLYELYVLGHRVDNIKGTSVIMNG